MSKTPRPPDESPFAGMTVNERLFTAGLLEQFDAAAHAQDEDRIRDLLAKVGLGGEAADSIIEWVKKSPSSRYRK